MVDRRPLGNIVVATDFSEGAKPALERACRLPITPGSCLTLLHVMPKLHASLFDRAERAARASLERLAEEARTHVPQGVEVFVAVEIGEPFVEIERRAEGERAELVVLGRHGRRAWRDALGTTVDRVLRYARTPALVVAEAGATPYLRPLVGVDEEGSAAAAIELMTRIASPKVRGALAVHVLGRDFKLAPYELPEELSERYHRERAEEARKQIELMLDELGGTELDFELRVVDDEYPAHGILEVARRERADLVVVGTHGRAGLRHMLFGSVAEAVIRRAEIDVLVAHPANVAA